MTTTATPAAPAAPQTAPPALPPPVALTDRARAEVRRIVANKQIPTQYGLRVGVKGGGCSGMSYVLGFDKQRDHDLSFELAADTSEPEGAGPITVYMDKRHGLYLMGTTVDYHDGLDARGFVFENPQATQTCGCGSSFSA